MAAATLAIRSPINIDSAVYMERVTADFPATSAAETPVKEVLYGDGGVGLRLVGPLLRNNLVAKHRHRFGYDAVHGGR